jgi:site-specific recombinase XerC
MMAKVNPANERTKRAYIQYLKDARGRDEATIDGVMKALHRFEESTGWRDFKKFHRQQAIAFKAKLADCLNARTGERLSKATMRSTLRDLRAFFFWLAHLPGFKSHIEYGDADYFNLSDKDNAIAQARRPKQFPTLEQVHHVLATMPVETTLQRRDRALIAFAALTAARAGALASFQIGHVNMTQGYVEQDARVVRTKFGKTFQTAFFPIGGDALAILGGWLDELRDTHLRGSGDPLFPATELGLGDGGSFQPVGISRNAWATSQPINAIFRKAFEGAGLPYFKPHSFRDMIVALGLSLDLSSRELKAWSQNLGHADMLTTLTSYGTLPFQQQAELIRATGQPHGHSDALDDPDIIELIAKIQRKGNGGLPAAAAAR